MINAVIHSDCLTWMKSQPTNSVDLVFGSPPYELARTYGVDFDLRDEEWVYWMTDITREAVRISKGLVAFVVEGQTRKFRYSATPLLLMADLHRMGICLRKPAIYHRHGIPGSGGPDWLRNNYEFIICCSKGGKLPWSDNTACGNASKYDEGGACTNRKKDGKRIGYADADSKKQFGSHRAERRNGRKYAKPKNGLANPGNVIHCKVGRGHMGSNLCHENEAPFPEKLADFFIRSFCPPGGVVYDPFSGSGTTAAVAVKNGRNWVSTDTRRSQIELTSRRVQEAQCHVQPISK